MLTEGSVHQNYRTFHSALFKLVHKIINVYTKLEMHFAVFHSLVCCPKGDPQCRYKKTRYAAFLPETYFSHSLLESARNG